ncbi:helix-turn-helix domain-containing protein [Streptomyces gobiensis]|uniref:helix-turn-helix domain-containing protein n=1 Tax=Streptomyces gobiensis TaxID=2875706 RepID=UPI002411699C|nr:helix-turn-helix transcriptional regulator [Streptomyces gobiensis]UGY93454.1 helix-turn-helix transcriptional regulator [Streptomyces gobiensis]
MRTRRLEVGMTQNQLAAGAGMSQAAISRLEHGTCIPTIPLLTRLAEALGSSLSVSIGPTAEVKVVFGERQTAAPVAGCGAEQLR